MRLKETTKTKIAELGYFLLTLGIVLVMNLVAIEMIIGETNMFLYNLNLIVITLFDAFYLTVLFWVFFLFDKIKVVRRE